ncbi:uncharacterized protein B0J16DRAFT_405639, partial [Fusarium flagelliforme]|uniref:uncharacterized protein n=1 Tax=Fusarium flagelliforme TaxID=2675880 RepID=UPI001E8C9D3B
MSFGFSVGDFLAVLTLAGKIRKDFKGAPSQFKSISDDVRSLSIVIQDAHANIDQMSDHQTANFAQILTTCKDLLKDVERMMDNWSVISKPQKGKAVQRLWKRLKWEPQEIMDLRARITSNVVLLNAYNDQATSHNVAKLVRQNEGDQKQSMLDWISSTDYIPQHNHLISRLQANSRRWLFNMAEYQEWEKQRGRTLFCPGDPGSGKTFTTAIVVETLQEQAQDNPDILITYVYCTYQAADQDVQGLLSSLLRNSLQQAPSIPEAIRFQCDRKRAARQGLLRDETVKLLETLYHSFDKVTLLVYALDELPIEVSRPFISGLLKLQRTCQLNMFLTSRHIPEIQQQFTKRGATVVEIRASDEDIHHFLQDSMLQLPRFVGRDLSLQNEIVKGITEASTGMFLLAELHLRSLKHKKSPRALRPSLEKLATGSNAYDNAYEDSMARIAGLGPESETLAKQALMIIVCAREALHTKDLTYALSVEPDSEALDYENIPDIGDVAGICAGLIIIDKQSDIVKLVHKSAQEYFERNQSRWFPNASEVMARLCINFKSLATLTPEFNRDIETTWPPFWRYADINWTYHSQRANEADGVAQVLDGNVNEDERLSSLQSLSNIAISLLATDIFGGLPSALSNACRDGRHALEKRLAREDSLLVIAAANGDHVMVRILLRHGADPNVAGILGQTPLYIAARYGKQTVVALLLDQSSINPDCEYRWIKIQEVCWTPLLAASYYGHKKCVRLLLDHAKRNYRDETGRNAACLAAEGGHVEVLEELLQWSDIELDPGAGFTGRSALDIALGHDNERAALALIPYSDLNCRYRWEMRALNVAVHARSLKAVGMILAQGDVNVNARGLLGLTALHDAATASDERLMVMILAHPNIDINVRDDDDDTPLIMLVRSLETELEEHSDALTSLLSNPELDINAQNLEGNTALLMAASFHLKTQRSNWVLQTLLSHPAVDKEHRNKLGQTVLTCAIMASSEMIQTIVKETQLSHQFREIDDGGETLLSLAAPGNWSDSDWRFIVDLSPPEFMHRQNRRGATPEQLR